MCDLFIMHNLRERERERQNRQLLVFEKKVLFFKFLLHHTQQKVKHQQYWIGNMFINHI